MLILFLATHKRFYRRTDIVQNEKNWEVTLDHKRLKTPNGKVLTVNTEPLARAIAAEWDAQQEHIAQPTMHIVHLILLQDYLICLYVLNYSNKSLSYFQTALCNTALDNPGKLTSHDIVSYLLDFIATDTLLFYSEVS